MTDQKERLIRHIARTIVWGGATPFARDSARVQAIAIVNDLLGASATGKAVERGLCQINARLDKSA